MQDCQQNEKVLDWARWVWPQKCFCELESFQGYGHYMCPIPCLFLSGVFSSLYFPNLKLCATDVYMPTTWHSGDDMEQVYGLLDVLLDECAHNLILPSPLLLLQGAWEQQRRPCFGGLEWFHGVVPVPPLNHVRPSFGGRDFGSRMVFSDHP